MGSLLLPNDFCCILSPQSGNAEGQMPYWVARVVKLTDKGTYRLNWFAEKPDEKGTFLKTDHYFYEDAAAVVPFKAGLISLEERDMYKASSPSAVEDVFKSMKTTKFGKGPSEASISSVNDQFREQLVEDTKISSDETHIDSTSVASSVPTQNDDEPLESHILKRKNKFLDNESRENPSFVAKKPKSEHNPVSPTFLRRDSKIAHSSWTKVSPKVGEKHQVESKILQQLLQTLSNDPTRRLAKDLSSKQKNYPKGRAPGLQRHTLLDSEKTEAQISELSKSMEAGWTSAEKSAFESAMYEHSELFHLVRDAVASAAPENAPRKTTAQCVEYFYDKFRNSRAYHIWYKQEVARLEKIERKRRENERQAIKDQRKKRKKLLQSFGINPKDHNYRGDSVVKSEKICNALIKIKKVVADKLGITKPFTPEGLSKLQQSNGVDFKTITRGDGVDSHRLIGEVNNMLSPNTLNTLKGITELSNVVENNVSQRKPVGKDLRSENQFKNIQGLISGMNEDSKSSQRKNKNLGTIGLNAGIKPMDQNQLSKLTQVLKQQTQEKVSLSARKQRNSSNLKMHGEKQGRNRRSGNSHPTVDLSNENSNDSRKSTPSVHQQAATNVQNVQLQSLQHLQQHLSQAHAQAQQQEQLQRAQLQAAAQQQPQLNNLAAVLAQMSKQNGQQSNNQNAQGSFLDAQNLQAIQHLQNLARAQVGNNASQAQLLQALQSRQQQQEHANHINQYLQLQQLGQIPSNMSLEQYMFFASQQEHAKQFRQLQLLHHLADSQRQQQQRQLQQQAGNSSVLNANSSAVQDMQQKALLLQQQRAAAANAALSLNRGQSLDSDQMQGQGNKGLERSFQSEHDKLALTNQQESIVLQMRQMQEAQHALRQGQDATMLQKKHEAERKNLIREHEERHMSLKDEYEQQNSRMHETTTNNGQKTPTSSPTNNDFSQTSALQILLQQQQQAQLQQQLAAAQALQARGQLQALHALQQQQNNNRDGEQQGNLTPEAAAVLQQHQMQTALMLEQMKNAAGNQQNAAYNLQQLQALQHLQQQQQIAQQGAVNQNNQQGNSQTQQQQGDLSQLNANLLLQQVQAHMHNQRQLQNLQLGALYAQQQQQQQQEANRQQLLNQASLQQLQAQALARQRKNADNKQNQ